MCGFLEYPTEFIVLRTNKKLIGYPLILGRPWLATVDAYISCRQGSMIIANGPSRKHLKIFPPAKPSTYKKVPLWIEEEDDPILLVLTIDKALYLNKQEEDDVYSNFLQNLYENHHCWRMMSSKKIGNPLEY